MRDLVPTFCGFLDRAVTELSRLDEPAERNAIRRHALERIAELREKLGPDRSESVLHRLATYRVFSSAPGTFGLGVGLALDASAWEGDADLAETYVNWGGYAYGGGAEDGGERHYGEAAHDLLARQLAGIEVAYMKQSSAEYDMLDCGGYAVFQGGMAAATRALGGGNPKLYWGDNTRPHDPDIRDVTDELDRTARVKLLNRRWIEDMKRHGYQGAQAVSSRVNSLFKWSATSRAVKKGIFDGVIETYIFNEENRSWLKSTNPYALEEITRRMLEAHARGLWAPDPEALEALRNTALDLEGDMEERMGDVLEEFQGGKVDVMTSRDVERWAPQWRMEAVDPGKQPWKDMIAFPNRRRKHGAG